MSRLPNPGRRPRPVSSLPRLGIYPMELSRNIRVDSVSRLDPDPPFGVEANETVAGAVEVMRRENANCLLVTDRGRLVGLFTERDLLTRVLAKGRPLETPIRAVMTLSPVTVEPKELEEIALDLLAIGGAPALLALAFLVLFAACLLFQRHIPAT